MKKRLLHLYLPLSMVLTGCLLLGYSYSCAQRKAELGSSLVKAVKSGDVSGVKSCLSEGADADTRDSADPALRFFPFLKRLFTRWQTRPSSDGASLSVLQILLREATQARYVGFDRSYDLGQRLPAYDAIGEALVRHGADTHFPMEDIELFGSPLRCAAMLGMHKTVQSLLVRGEDVNARDAYGFYPIIEADAESTAMLLTRGARPNVCAEAEGKTALHGAAEEYERGTETIRLLLAAGANPNVRDKAGQTPLMLTHAPESAKLLIQYGANVNAKAKDGSKVLDFAQGLSKRVSRVDRDKLVILLKQHGATK